MPHADPTYSPGDLSQRYVCKVDTILHAIATGKLRAINIGLGSKKPRWRITQESLDAFEAERGNSPAGPIVRRRRKKPSAEYRDYFGI